ncbi:hypothetical protein PaG_04699 [Moesziomyces aphidis]|uniref:Uncharacterized protein n=1 Tax=Moesziomyces aphidis TaxID=84754 RepID=W3VJ19_MOEAP|nr:hypothetical protein PaG_04699 [Moesziomyces aphidis]
MGSCMSKNAAVVEEVNPAPHPEARRVWLVSTPVDAKDVPLDLVGIDSDGLKAAMRNRGLETDHWALKIDPPSNLKAEPSIFDITLEGGKLVSALHTTSSPYWKGITRRVAIGWSIWKDDEIMHACKQLINARPKYDGRSNNSQQLARLLGRHVDFVPQPPKPASTAAPSEIIAAEEPSPAASILKPESLQQETNTNRSQMTLVSGAHSQRSHSIESDPKEAAAGPTETNGVSRVPASIRQSQRMSIAKPPLIHLSTAPSEHGGMARPKLERSAETDPTTPTGSVRMSLPPQPRQQSPLNPSPRTHRQTASEIRVDGRVRARSDAPAYATVGAADHRVSRPTRRRSEAPSEWLAELPDQARFQSMRSRGGQGRNSHRDSMLSTSGSVLGSPMATWGPSMGMPPSPSMAGVPMSPPMPPMGMGMWPGATGSMGPSGSMMFNPAALQVPMPYFAQPPMGMSMGMGLPYMPSMPMLAPPSPGFHSHTSSAVHTPPESPQMSTTHLPAKPMVPEMAPAFAQAHHFRT